MTGLPATAAESTGSRPLPAVTVVIPTRDRPALLRTAVDAVLAQDYPGEVRCVVVHDGTEPDRSLERDTVTVTRNVRSPGLAGARNSGIALAETELVAFCDDDDRWLPGKLSRQVEVFRSDPDGAVRQLRHPGPLRRARRRAHPADGPGHVRRPAAGPADRAAPVDVPHPALAAGRDRAGGRGAAGQLRRGLRAAAAGGPGRAGARRCRPCWSRCSGTRSPTSPAAGRRSPRPCSGCWRRTRTSTGSGPARPG